MSLRPTRRPTLQRLEDRTTPSVSTTLTSGTLTIKGDNLSNNLVILETATPGKFAVSNNGSPIGQFSFSNLNVQMGNGNDSLDLGIKTALTGNFTATMGNGSDFVTTENSVAGARIGGNTLINLGLGTPLGVAAKIGQAYDQAIRLYNLKFQGQSTQVIGPSGSGAELLDVTNATISGALSVTNIYQTALGSILNLANSVTVGSVSVNNAQKNTDSRTDAFVGPGNDLLFFNKVTVLGNVSYTGGTGKDDIDLPGDAATSTPAVINGSVTVNTGDGVGTLSLGTGGTNGASAQVGGNVTFTGGSAGDRFFLDTGASVGGNVNVNLGEGDNKFLGDGFDPIFSASVGGDMTLTAGNGNNFLGSYGGGGGSLSVNGNLRVQFGNGDNTGSGGGGEITFFNTAMSVGAVATYQAGTGSNTLDITNDTIASLRLLFSGGPTTVLFNQADGNFSGNLYLDFGVGLGPKTLGGSAGFDGGSVTILNYP